MKEKYNFNIKDECEGCIHKDGCGIDEFFWEETNLSEEERFVRHCVGCCCGDGCECNKSSGCSNYEDGTGPILGQVRRDTYDTQRKTQIYETVVKRLK